MKGKFGASVVIRILMWLAFIFGGAALGFSLDFRFFPSLVKSVSFHVVSFLLGALLMKAVLTVSKNTGRTLAKYGRQGELPRMETNRLATEGVYSKMRHPMHLGLFFAPLAFALIIGSPSFIFFIAPAEALFMYILVITLEEKEAIRKFGDEYLRYKEKVPGFCLKMDCIKKLFEKVEK